MQVVDKPARAAKKATKKTPSGCEEADGEAAKIAAMPAPTAP